MRPLEFESRLQLARCSVETVLRAVRMEDVDGFNAATYSRLHRELEAAERSVCKALDEAQSASGRAIRGLVTSSPPVRSLIGTDAFPPPYGTKGT